MKNIEKLKEEQSELKERLHRLIDFINSDEYFNIPEGEKSLLNSQRTGMELYLNALTNRIYSNVNVTGFASSSILPLLFSLTALSSSTPIPSLETKEMEKIVSSQSDKENNNKE